MDRVDMHITVQTEQREDHWACYVPEFGFTVYGESRADANQQVDSALAALLSSFNQDIEAISKFLESRNVNHSIQNDASSHVQAPVIEARRVEVPIAA